MKTFSEEYKSIVETNIEKVELLSLTKMCDNWNQRQAIKIQK